MQMRLEKRALDKIYKRRDRYEIPDWQREKVWATEKKQMLIDSILRGWKLPKFYFLKVSSNPDEYEVVDGQQRLLSIFEFFGNEFPLSDSSVKEFKGKLYKDLHETVSDRFDDYEIEFDEITEAEEKDLKEFFQRLQEGLPLTSSEKLNSIHSNLRDYIKKNLSKHNFFKNKVGINDKRYAHFDIASKVAAIEIEGIDTGLRFEDLKKIFEGQASFSNQSNVAKRLKETFDFLDKVFSDKSSLLRNRTIVQSLATFVARLIPSGKMAGMETKLYKFFQSFVEELSRQVTLGQNATDYEYLEFQKTVSSNVRLNAQIRNEILLRKLLLFDPGFADILGTSIITESAMEKSLIQIKDRIEMFIQRENEKYGREHGHDLFKMTTKTIGALKKMGSPSRSYTEYKEWMDSLYFLFRESVGTRLEDSLPPSFIDINVLRTAERHDESHGKAVKIAAKKKKFGAVFKKYSGVTTPETLAPEKFVVVQSAILHAIESDMQNLKWE